MWWVWLVPADSMTKMLVERRNEHVAAIGAGFLDHGRQTASLGFSFDRIDHLPLPELARALRSRIEPIIEAWLEQVREVLPHTRNKPPYELRDNLPLILPAMADALEAADDEGRRPLLERSPLQGITRFKQAYDVRELMTEDRLLRRIIIEHAEAALDRRMTLPEQVALDMGIDLMTQQAVVAFVEHQNAQLREAAEAELKYLSFLSHDVNNNLAAVTLSLQLLKTDLAGSADFATHAETLDAAQQAVLATIGGMGRLLDSERLRKGGIKPAIREVNLRTLLRGEGRRVEKQAERLGLKIVVDVPHDLHVHSDPELINLVVQNFISNAIKYSPAGATVRIAAECDAVDRSRCVISVSDQGPGIAPDRLGRIFEAFNRGDAHGRPGVGLGLAIASQAAKLLGAELTVESKLGAGSTFRLALRAGAVSQSTLRAATPPVIP